MTKSLCVVCGGTGELKHLFESSYECPACDNGKVEVSKKVYSLKKIFKDLGIAEER